MSKYKFCQQCKNKGYILVERPSEYGKGVKDFYPQKCDKCNTSKRTL